MKRFLVFLYMVLMFAAPAVAQQVVAGAAPTKEFLLGKTHFEKDTNLIRATIQKYDRTPVDSLLTGSGSTMDIPSLFLF